MRFVSVALIFVVVAMASASGSKDKVHYDVSNAHSLFEKFVTDFSKEYKDDADKEIHFQAFLNNLEKINKMNERDSSATYGINKFADYTEEERKNMFGLRKPPN